MEKCVRFVYCTKKEYLNKMYYKCKKRKGLLAAELEIISDKREKEGEE